MTAGVVSILVVGDTILDRDVEGAVHRVCPDAPAPVVDVGGSCERPGGAALAALLLHRRGAAVTLATRLGVDAAADRVRELLAGVEVVPLGELAQTRTVTRVRAGGQTLVRLDTAAGDRLTGPDPALLRRAVRAADAVLVADYGGGVSADPAVRQVLEQGAGDRPLVWDPHPRGGPPVPGTAVATPNRAEVAQALLSAGLQASRSPLDEAAGELRRHWRVAAVAATDGARGVLFAAADTPPLFVPAPRAVPGDCCGAGDRFAGGVALGLATGATAPAAVTRAVADVAGWLERGGVAAESSTATRTANAPAPMSGAERLDATRSIGGVVVATGGCFDVLHAGHVASLEAARALGDHLVVLLNSDRSVRRLKGPSRPVHPVADRRRVLESLSCVDHVVVFDEDDPRAALATLRPDIWAKGADYDAPGMPEAELLPQWGGRLVLLPYLPDRSTTRILDHAAARVDRSHPSLTADQEVLP